MAWFKQKWPEHSVIELNGKDVAVRVNLSKRSRHYRLTIQRGGEPVLSVPPNGRWADAEAFLVKQKHWLAARLKRTPKAVAFVDGIEIPLRGEPIFLQSSTKLRGRVERVSTDEGERLIVPGGHEHLARRLTDWLKSEAKADLSNRSAFHAARLGVSPRSIHMKGQSTRWGSCSSAKRLNYNWRLVLAPPFVLDYVAAHEVAHLREMNHSAAFWDCVTETLPDMSRGRAWLKAHGSELMVYGLQAAPQI